MNPKLQLNTGRLLNLFYAPLQGLNGTLTENDNEVNTGNFEIPLQSNDSVVRITFYFSVLFTATGTADGDEFLQIAIFRNDNPSQIFTGNYSLVPFVSPAAVNGEPVSFEVTIVDNTPRFVNLLTDTVFYNIRIQAINLNADESVELLTLDSLTFEEIANAIEVTIPNSSLIPPP